MLISVSEGFLCLINWRESKLLRVDGILIEWNEAGVDPKLSVGCDLEQRETPAADEVEAVRRSK